jgi:hypothetical protein
MKKRKRILLALMCVVLVCLAAFFISRSGPRSMTVELSGTRGLKVAGTYDADGTTFNFSGVIPTNFVVEAKHFKYTIKKLGSEGDLQGKLLVEDEEVGSSSTTTPFGGVAGGYFLDSSLFYRKAGSHFTTVSQEE